MKIKASSFFSLALALVIFAPAQGLALGIRIADQDPAATARGNAFAATADNPSAIYYNPAGITQLEGNNASIGVYGIFLNSDYKGNGVSQSTKDEIQGVPQFYYTLTLEKCPISFGLGLYSPYGLSLEWPDKSPFRTLATRGNITYLTLNPVLAWRVHPTLSIAAGPTLNYADADLRRGIIPFPLNPGDQFRFHGDDTDLGFNAGILWKPIEKLSFGANYRSETTMDFSGRSSTKGADAFGVPSGSQSASARFPFPQNIVAGVSFRPTPKWNIEFDVDWTDWDRLNTVTLKQASGPLLLPFNWRSSFFYEWGVTRYFEKGWYASAGYIFSENSVPDKNFNPIVPDSDRHIFSIGVGRKYEHWRWDAAYQLAYGPERNVTSNTPNPLTGESANGRYEFISHALTFSIGYHF
jgi:long-chain fatty acid transport protein